jgi:hypothetical protein
VSKVWVQPLFREGLLMPRWQLHLAAPVPASIQLEVVKHRVLCRALKRARVVDHKGERLFPDLIDVQIGWDPENPKFYSQAWRITFSERTLADGERRVAHAPAQIPNRPD